MDSFFNIHFISELIEKLETEEITLFEHEYLQKTISAFILIQQYNKKKFEPIEINILKYYNWLHRNNTTDPKLKTEFFLLKTDIENYCTFFGIKLFDKIPKLISQYEQLQILAQIWKYNLVRNKENVLHFLTFLIEKLYGVSNQYIKEIFNFLVTPWKPILSPIAAIPHKKFSLEEIEEYFFGGIGEQIFESHVLPNADRLFTITNSKFKNHIFLPKKDNFDIFEAALVVHEFQHIQDSTKVQENSLFIAEKNALNAERIFLNMVGSGKRGKFCWLESNLFYPLALLKWELDIILYNAYDINNFYNICHSHSLEPIAFSPLFNWRSPFQMSAYCAASMELEPNWKNYLHESGVYK